MRNIDVERLKKHGLNLKDFAPQKTDSEKIAELEQIIEEQNVALMELAELITEVADIG